MGGREVDDEGVAEFLRMLGISIRSILPPEVEFTLFVYDRNERIAHISTVSRGITVAMVKAWMEMQEGKEDEVIN